MSGSIFNGVHFGTSAFRYQSGHQSNELCKDGSGLKFWKQLLRPFIPDPEGHTMTFDRVWALLLTAEKDTRRGTTQHLLKVIYGGGMSGCVNRQTGERNQYLCAPFSSVKMKTEYLFRVEADRWADFVESLEEWAAHNEIAVVHDYD